MKFNPGLEKFEPDIKLIKTGRFDNKSYRKITLKIVLFIIIMIILTAIFCILIK